MIAAARSRRSTDPSLIRLHRLSRSTIRRDDPRGREVEPARVGLGLLQELGARDHARDHLGQGLRRHQRVVEVGEQRARRTEDLAHAVEDLVGLFAQLGILEGLELLLERLEDDRQGPLADLLERERHLDLGGAFVDRRDDRVGVELADLGLGHEAEAAVDLDCVPADVVGRLGPHVLGERRQQPDARCVALEERSSSTRSASERSRPCGARAMGLSIAWFWSTSSRQR